MYNHVILWVSMCSSVDIVEKVYETRNNNVDNVDKVVDDWEKDKEGEKYGKRNDSEAFNE